MKVECIHLFIAKPDLHDNLLWHALYEKYVCYVPLDSKHTHTREVQLMGDWRGRKWKIFNNTD